MNSLTKVIVMILMISGPIPIEEGTCWNKYRPVHPEVRTSDNCVGSIDLKHTCVPMTSVVFSEYPLNLSLAKSITRPKIKFPTCPVFQNMTFPHISYTYLAEDRATFHANE